MTSLKKYCSFLIAAALLLVSCNDDEHKRDMNGNLGGECNAEQVSPYSANNKVIYQVNLRNYSLQGNFKGLENDLCRLKNLGVDAIWLMPIHPIGKINRTGSKGSPYAVQDYMAINPDYGTAADLKSLIQAAHDKDMEIWLDLVANHTAWDHPWITSNIDYYATSSTGERPYSPSDANGAWSDVAQLNFSNPELRQAMINIMKYWVQEFDIDGYRCDAVSYVPVSFWNEAIPAVNSIKRISWLAESDNANYMENFDYDYAWGFNDALNNFGKDKKVSTLVSECKKLFDNRFYQQKSKMVYLTNHDLNAYHGTEFKRYGDFVWPLTVLSFTIYDMPLIYNGQEIAFNKVMPLFDIRYVEWKNGDLERIPFFEKLTALRRTHPALESGANRGELTFYDTSNSKVVAYSRVRDGKSVLVLLNFAEEDVTFTFSGTTPAGEYTNYLENGTVTITGGTEISIPVNGYKILVN